MQLDGTYLVEAELMMILMARNRSNNTNAECTTTSVTEKPRAAARLDEGRHHRDGHHPCHHRHDHRHHHHSIITRIRTIRRVGISLGTEALPEQLTTVALNLSA